MAFGSLWLPFWDVCAPLWGPLGDLWLPLDPLSEALPPCGIPLLFLDPFWKAFRSPLAPLWLIYFMSLQAIASVADPGFSAIHHLSTIYVQQHTPPKKKTAIWDLALECHHSNLPQSLWSYVMFVTYSVAILAQVELVPFHLLCLSLWRLNF